MHTTRRFFLALLTVGIGIAVPMTLKPSAAALALLWSFIAVALLGTLLTWHPVARRVPYRVVNVPSPRVAADAALGTECATLANEMLVWLGQHELVHQDQHGYRETKIRLPPEFGQEFDGRLFDTLDKLATRGCISREEVLQRSEYKSVAFISSALDNIRLLDGWARRLRRK